MNKENNPTVLEQHYRFCPICDRWHLLDLYEEQVQVEHKGECVKYAEQYYACDGNQWCTGTMLDENNARLRVAYERKMRNK